MTMDQLQSCADARLLEGCIYCGGATESRDHVPSRVLLDEPYPENLPVVPACEVCNRGYSLDEQYFACLAECARTGSIEAVQRPKIIRLLHDNPALAERIRRARTVTGEKDISFSVEPARARNVAVKLARGHAAYEASEIARHEPSHVLITPLTTLEPAAREHFETVPISAIWPEVGSRAMQRLIIGGDDVTSEGWIEVQPEQYRYFVVAEGPVLVRIVVSEYVACEVIWSSDD
jgi:hypothetical protein